MNKYEPKKFNIPALIGISQKNIEEHLKLYEGYVKNANLILEKVNDLSKKPTPAENIHTLTELQRRFSFEFNGIRNHEYYFSALEGGPHEISDLLKDSSEVKVISNDAFVDLKPGLLKSMIEKQWGSFEKWLDVFKTIAKTRGIGWAMLYYDQNSDCLLNNWVDEQHIGQLNGLKPILCLDMWEHSFVADYQPSGKGQYIDDFFENLNWQVVESNLLR